MRQRRMLFVLMLVVLLGLSPITIANAIPFSADDIDISIAPGYAIVKGIWIADSQENAFLLLGSEDDNVMKVAIASQTGDGQYQIVALSEKILAYDEYHDGDVELLDHMNDGRPYFWFIARDGESRAWKDIYIVAKQDASGDWIVSGGYCQYYEPMVNYSFSTTENPNELIVYDTCCPQIYWPIKGEMSLDHFDFSAVEKICIEALRYLKDFQSSHQFGDQDENYRIVWTF